MESANIAGIEVGEEDMYRKMKEEALTFIADLFINLQEHEISLHDEIAKSSSGSKKESRRSWIGPSDQPGTALWAKVSGAQSAT